MIRQGLSVQIVPLTREDDVYSVSLHSTVWEAGEIIGSRIIELGKVEMPYGVSVQPENGLWMGDFLEVAQQMLRRQYGTPLPMTVSDANGHVSGG